MKISKKIAITLSLFFFSFSICTFAQQFKKVIKKESLVKATIFQYGKEVSGYMQKTGFNYEQKGKSPAPWKFQYTVHFVTDRIYNMTTVFKPQHFQKITTENCDGYIYEGREYVAVNAEKLGEISIGQKRIFLEKESEGTVDYFIAYDGSMFENQHMLPEDYPEDYKKPDPVPIPVCRIFDGQSALFLGTLDIEKELRFCPTVQANFQKGNYDVTDKLVKPKNRQESFQNVKIREAANREALNDYVQYCKPN